ncbi:MAG: histidine phosphatase family protein [Actinomycetota bacterium]
MSVAPAVLVLLRHGEADTAGRCAGQRLDPSLTRRGRSQAVSARHRLAMPIDEVVSAPAARARQTASAWTAEPSVEAGLAERDFGAWEGRRWEELWAGVAPEVLADPDAYAALTPPGAETLAEVEARAWSAAERLAVEGRRVLAVTHAGPLRLVLARALGLRPAQAFALAADHGRAAVLRRHGRAWTLEALGA